MTDTEDEKSGATPDGSAGDAGSAAADSQRLLANRYRLDSLLGRGSMGAVWKALDVVLGRSVAVKEVLLPSTQTDEEHAIARERALREARSIAALSHPNVVTLYDVVEDDGRPWVVMELVPAKNLAEIIRDDGTLTPAEAARIGLAVLAALESAHEVGITHRDVKPGNILVSPDGRVKLADFGISRRAEDSALTRTGLMVGSPSYIAPEVARGRAAGSAADIWGLGATLQCAVEGTPPFDLGDPVATLTAVVGDPPKPAPHAGALQPLLTRMLQKDPRDRIRPAEARRELEAIVAAGATPPPTYAPPTGPLAPASGSMRTPAAPGVRPGAPAVPPGAAPGVGSVAAAGGPPQPDYPPRTDYPTRPGYPPRPAVRPAQPTSQALRPVSRPQPAFGQPHPTSHTMRAPHAPYRPGTGRTPAPGTGRTLAPGTGRSPAPVSGRMAQPPVPPHPVKKRGASNPWVAALIGLLLAALIGAAVILWVANDGSGTGSGSSSSSGGSLATPVPYPTANNTQLDGTTASGAIQVDGVFRPFSLELPAGWEVAEVAENLQNGRSEFLQSDGGTDPSTMVKVTVVAEPLSGGSADKHLQQQMQQIGSPAMLPEYAEISYEVTSQGNVLWQYQSVLQGVERRGYLYATVRGEDILWKVLTSAPGDSGQTTADIANDVIGTFEA